MIAKMIRVFDPSPAEDFWHVICKNDVLEGGTYMKTHRGNAPIRLIIGLFAISIAVLGCGNDEALPAFGNAGKGETEDTSPLFEKLPFFRMMLHALDQTDDSCGALRELLFLGERTKSVLKIVRSNHEYIKPGSEIAFSGFRCTDTEVELHTEWDGFSFKFEKTNDKWLFTGTRAADCYEEEPTTVFSCDTAELCSMEISQPFIIADRPECGAKEECEKVLGMFERDETCETVARVGFYQRVNDKLVIRYDHYIPEDVGTKKVGTLDLVLQPVL